MYVYINSGCVIEIFWRFTFEMAELLSVHSHGFTKFSSIYTYSSKTKTKSKMPKPSWRPSIECVLSEDNRRVVLRKGKDSLDISRVVNGMWQTSGGWGRIEKNSAVDAMLKYADAGLTTFDMADICMPLNHI